MRGSCWQVLHARSVMRAACWRRQICRKEVKPAHVLHGFPELLTSSWGAGLRKQTTGLCLGRCNAAKCNEIRRDRPCPDGEDCDLDGREHLHANSWHVAHMRQTHPQFTHFCSMDTSSREGPTRQASMQALVTGFTPTQVKGLHARHTELFFR